MLSLHVRRKRNSDMDEKKIKKIILVIFVSALLIAIGINVMLFARKGTEDGFNQKDFISFNEGWTVTCGGKSSYNIKLPTSDPVGTYPDPVYFSNKLPDDIRDSWYLAMPTTLQTVRITVDGKELDEYEGGKSLLSTCVPANKWFYVKIDSSMSGKTILIETNSEVTSYHGRLLYVYLGDATDISYRIVRKCWYLPSAGVLLFMSGLMLTILNFFSVKMGNPDFSDIYMYGYLMMIGVWFMMSTALSQGMIGDVALSRAAEFYALMFLPILVLKHIENITHNRFINIAAILSVCSIVSIAFITICVYAFGQDFMTYNWITLAIIAITIIFGAYDFYVVIKEEPDYFKTIRTFTIGTACFGLSAVAEMIFTLVDPLAESGQLIAAGSVLYAIFVLKWKNEKFSEERDTREKALSQANAKGTFLANMSHEIRTPVSAIIAIDQMIMRESNEQQILSYAEDIQLSSLELHALINKVLDSARIEYGKMKIFDSAYSTYDLAAALIELADNKGAGSAKANFKYDHEMPSGLKGDMNRIVQVMGYLFENAVKHTDDGNIVIGMSVKKKSDKDCMLELCVADTGCGIAEEELENIFVSFRKDEHESSGMGLGLYLANNFVKMMNGTISVKSIKSVGSVFTVEIPQKITDNAPVEKICFAEEESHDYARLTKLRMLIVDDSPINLRIIITMLREIRADADFTSSGIEALEKAKRKRYDLVIMDHIMPGMDGEETFKRLRESDGASHNTPVIMMTADDDEEYRRKVIKAGFADVLVKPITMKMIEEAVERLGITGGAANADT